MLDYKPLPPFDFSLAKRNFALEEAGIVKPFPTRKTGTTIVAAIYKDGLVMAADTRITVGNIVVDKIGEKIQKITKCIHAASCGTCSDASYVADVVEGQMTLLELNSGRRAMVANAARVVQQLLGYYRGYLETNFIIGGVDWKGPHIYDISGDGSSRMTPYIADGSGGYLATSVLERDFKWDMEEDECKELVKRAVTTGMHGDLASGNAYYVVTIHQEGSRTEGPFTPDFAKPTAVELAYGFKKGSSRIIKETVIEAPTMTE